MPETPVVWSEAGDEPCGISLPLGEQRVLKMQSNHVARLLASKQSFQTCPA